MLKQAFRKIIKGQKGQALPIVLILFVIGGLLIVPTLNYASTSLKGHQVVESKTLELYSADSGVEDAIHWLWQGGEPGGSWTWDDGEQRWERDTYQINNNRNVDVTVKERNDIGTNVYEITSTATSPDGSTTILSIVWAMYFHQGDFVLDSNDEMEGSVYVNGNITLNSNSQIGGDAYATGDITLDSNSQIGGNVCANGHITLNSNSIIEGGVSANGDIILDSNSQIGGNVCANGNITLRSNAVIEGSVYANGNVMLNSNAVIKGNVSANGDITLDSNTVIESDAYATGDITLDSNARVEGSSNPHWEEDLPLPECPQMPEMQGPTKIMTWQIT